MQSQRMRSPSCAGARPSPGMLAPICIYTPRLNAQGSSGLASSYVGSLDPATGASGRMRRHSIASSNDDLSHRMVHLSQHHLNQLDKALKEVNVTGSSCICRSANCL